MEDKNPNLFFDNPALFCDNGVIDAEPLKIVENSVELDGSFDFEPTSRWRNMEPISFEMPVDAMPLFADMDFAAKPSKENCSLAIMGEPTINKPKNLKYPKKRRKQRVLKKRKRRYGTTPRQLIYLPNVEMEYIQDEQGLTIKVKPK